MAGTLYLKCQPLFLSKHSLFPNPTVEMILTYPQSTNIVSQSLLFQSSPFLSHQTQIKKHIICARRNRRESGSQKVWRILPKLISILISNPNILQPPLNIVIGEITSEHGMGIRFLKSFKGGSFNGSRRKEKKILVTLGLLAVCGLCFLLIAKGDVFCGVLALGLFGAVLIKGYKRGVRDWIFGLSLFAALMGLGLGLKREHRQKWIERLGVSSPVLELGKGKRRMRW